MTKNVTAPVTDFVARPSQPVTPEQACTPVFMYHRVHALTWCPCCLRQGKHIGLLVCWTCNTRLKRAYDGTHGPLDRWYTVLNERLGMYSPEETLKWFAEQRRGKQAL
jgi:hypothetical protein